MKKRREGKMEGGEKIEGNGKEIKKECGGRLE